MRRLQISALLRPAALLCVVASLAAALHSQKDPAAGFTDNDCRQAVTTSAMRACEDARYETAQRELNSAYQSLLQHLDNSRKQKLHAAQRAWLQFRDANAEFQASLAQGGTLAPLLKITCMAEMTEARISELKKASLP